ncbi:MAG TPA: polysaccharide deacetylase family protein [Aggregatilineales bacterium]|nr:polysaccharide deacetylase family protein [Aggregatilineales bacterium]
MLRSHRLFRLVILSAVLLTGLVLFSHASPSGASRPFRVYLTFDDGPIPGNTNVILDILKKYGVKATFFDQGSHIHGNEQYLRREILEGHHIGNHLVFHDPIIMSPVNPPDSLVLAKYAETDAAIRYALGGLAGQWDIELPVKLFRWPGGAIHAIPLPDVITYNWTSATHDSGGVTPYGALYNALYGATEVQDFGAYGWGDGTVILIHDWSRSSITALPLIIENLRDNGATFETLPRPGDKPGTMPIVLGDVPPCAKHGGSCTALLKSFSFQNTLPTN